MIQLLFLWLVYAVRADIDLIGTYDGPTEFFKFSVDESQDLGGDLKSYSQINRIDIQEQEGSFVRGAEYWSSDRESWFFVCYVFGEISQKSKQPNIYSVRLQEYFNKLNTSNPHDQEETLGLLVGYYDTDTEDMYLDYTGQTLSLQMFGAQSFVATKTNSTVALTAVRGAVDIDVRGNFDGTSLLQQFGINESLPMGDTINSYNLSTRLSIQEQNESFVRGIEYLFEESQWVFYCNFFGVLAQKSNQPNIYSVRLQQFLNSDDEAAIQDSDKLLGERVGYYDSDTGDMYIDYTGQTLSLSNFGGESYMASRTSTPVQDLGSLSATYPSLLGTYDGSAKFYEFWVDESQDLGGDLKSYSQINRIDIQEQEGSFVRGAEYWSSDRESWFFVCYVFGEISQKSKQPNIYSVRLQEYFNKLNTSNPHDQEETLGLLVGYYDTDTEDMYLDYTGQTLSLQKFGAQSFVATKTSAIDNDDPGGDGDGGGGNSNDDDTDDLPGGWLIVILMCIFGGGPLLAIAGYKLHDYYDVFGLKKRAQENDLSSELL